MTKHDDTAPAPQLDVDSIAAENAALRRRLAEIEEAEENTLLLHLAYIRQKSGVGIKPMLSELADAIAEKINGTPPAPNVAGIEDGIERAARYIEKQRDDYVQEFGNYDPSTGVTEFSIAGEEYLSTLEELIEGIRALHEQASPPAPRVVAPDDYREKLSSFLDALDEWGCDDNGERAEHIIEFQRTGYDLDAYLEDHPDRPKQEVN